MSLNGVASLPVERLLDDLLSKFESERTDDDSKATEDSHHRVSHHQKQNEVLRVADFLFGNKLEGALRILDAAESSDCVTHFVSVPSRRNAYVIESSSTYSSRKRSRSSMTSSGEESYFCVVPRPTDDLPVYFCSCRSFLESTRSNKHCGDDSCLCKHLLALRLMTIFGVKPTLRETLSDSEFAKLILRRLSYE